MKIALDAGHGAGTGARGNGLVEDELNFEMVGRIGHYIRLAGHKTLLLRPDNRNIPITIRTANAKAGNCDILVSIHFNAGPPSARGAECFVAAGDKRSHAVAARILAKITALNLPSRGVKEDNQSAHTRLGILRNVYRQMPAVLVESAFLTNTEDAKLLRDKYFKDRLAKAIAEAILGS